MCGSSPPSSIILVKLDTKSDNKLLPAVFSTELVRFDKTLFKEFVWPSNEFAAFEALPTILSATPNNNNFLLVGLRPKNVFICSETCELTAPKHSLSLLSKPFLIPVIPSKAGNIPPRVTKNAIQ